MRLESSCHCGAVRFFVESHEPVPFMRCYCSICRKTAGSGGFAVNPAADHATLQVHGRERLGVYRARLQDGRRSSGERHFYRECGTTLWLYVMRRQRAEQVLRQRTMTHPLKGSHATTHAGRPAGHR